MENDGPPNFDLDFLSGTGLHTYVSEPVKLNLYLTEPTFITTYDVGVMHILNQDS